MKPIGKKALGLLIFLLIAAACKKDKEVPIPASTEQNKMAFITDQAGKLYAVNAQTSLNLWTWHNNGTGTFAAPAIYKNAVITANTELETLSCISLQTGAAIWDITETAINYSCSPIVVNDRVIIGVQNRVVQYRFSDGTIQGTTTLDEKVNGLNFSNGIIIANTCSGHLFGIEPAGTIRWEYKNSNACYHHNPAIADKTIYILDAAGRLAAVNSSSGSENWSIQIANLVMDAPVVYNNGLLFIVSAHNEKIYAFNAANGNLAHTYKLPAGVTTLYYKTPAVLNGRLFVIAPSGDFMAFDTGNENMLWRIDLDPGSIPPLLDPPPQEDGRIAFPFSTAVTAANDMVFAGIGKYLYAVDIYGNKKWQLPLLNQVAGSPVILSNQDKVYRSGVAGIVE